MLASRNDSTITALLLRRLGMTAALLVLVGGGVPGGPAVAGREQAPAVLSSPGPRAEATGRIDGRVLNDAGSRPVEGAEVFLLDPPPPGQDVYVGPLPIRSARADPTGRFAFTGLAPGRYRVWANSGSSSSRTRRLAGQVVVIAEAGEGPQPVDLRLKPALSLDLRIKDAATGQPIPGASVGFTWSDFTHRFPADAAGLVVAEPLTAEVWVAEVRADGYAEATRSFPLDAGPPAEAEFLLAPGGGFEGVVRDPAGRPLADIGLSVGGPDTYQHAGGTRTDAAGRYRLAHLPAEANLRLSISEMDYLPIERPLRPTRAVQTLDLTLEPRPDGGSITGLIVDPLGQPVAGAEVSNVGNNSGHVRRTTTGPDGRYLLKNLVESMYGKEIYVRANGLAPRRLPVAPGPADQPATVDVALEPGHQVAGRVVDEAGKPLEGVLIFVQNAATRGIAGRRTTGPDGIFRFDSLPAEATAPSRLDLLKKGYSDARNRVVPLDSAEPVDVALTAEGVVRGRVVDAATGRPIPAFNVRRTFSTKRPNPPNSSLSGRIDAPGFPFQSPDGSFELKELVAGMTLQVTVAASGYEPSVVDPIVVARAGEPASTEFVLEPIDPATLTPYAGRLHDAAGRAVAGAEVRLIAREPPPPGVPPAPIPSWGVIRDGQLVDFADVVRFLKATTDDQGRFRFDPVPRDLAVSLAWWGPGVAPVVRDGLEQVADPDRAALDLEVLPPGRIVVVVDRRKYPTAATIQIFRGVGMIDYSSRPVPPDGAEIVIADLAPGKYQITLIPAYKADPKTPNGLIAAPDLATLEAVVAPGATVRVELKD